MESVRLFARHEVKRIGRKLIQHDQVPLQSKRLRILYLSCLQYGSSEIAFEDSSAGAVDHAREQDQRSLRCGLEAPSRLVRRISIESRAALNTYFQTRRNRSIGRNLLAFRF